MVKYSAEHSMAIEEAYSPCTLGAGPVHSRALQVLVDLKFIGTKYLNARTVK